MKFFVDLEATQFAGKIISMGVVSETGEKFYTLMKPYKSNITPFIEKLTGITNEMIQKAPEPDLAFQLFGFWLNEVYYKTNITNNFNPEFYFYGNEDKKFIKATLQHMTNINSYMIAENMLLHFNDFSSIIKQHFNTKTTPSLAKVYAFCKEEENFIQRHNALEDAEMLAEVATKIDTIPDTVEVLPEVIKKTIYPERKKTPEIFLSWAANKKQDMWDVCTKSKTESITLYCKMGDYKKFFDNEETAALWLIKFVIKTGSPKDSNYVNSIIKKIRNTIANGNEYCGMRWYREEED